MARTSIPTIGWEQVSPAPIVLLFGKEGFFADRALQRLRALMIAEDPELEVTDLDAGTYVDGALAMHASPSLFSEPRLIRITNGVKATDSFLDEALRYIASPVEGTTVVLRHDGSTARGKKLLDAIRSSSGALEVTCQPLKPKELTSFAWQEFRMLGREATPAAIAALVEAFATDIAELAGAIRQVAIDTASPGAGPVTDDTVRTYYAGRVETTAFAVVDAVIAGDAAQAIVTLRQALATGCDPVPLVAAFAMRFRQLAKASGVQGSDSRAAREIGMQDWQLRNAKRDLAKFTDVGLCEAIAEIATTDAAIKGAERSAEYALERLVRRLAA